MLWASRGPQDLFQCLNFRFTNFQDFQKFSQDQIFNYTRSESHLVRRRVGCEISCRSCSESGRSEKSVNRGIREIRQQSLDERCESSASETGQCPFRKSRSTNREILFLNWEIHLCLIPSAHLIDISESSENPPFVETKQFSKLQNDDKFNVLNHLILICRPNRPGNSFRCTYVHLPHDNFLLTAIDFSFILLARSL